MKDRIREVRESLVDENGRKLSQAKFAQRIGVSISSAQKWEIGASVPNNSAIALIAEKCGVSETWLRTGQGEMHEARGRAEEMADLVKRLMADRPDSFRSALVNTLLRLDPGGPEWAALENIYNGIVAEQKKSREP